MEDRSQAQPRLVVLALALSAASLIALLSLASQRGSWSTVAGDESTFLAMAESLAADGDLEFSEADATRLRRAEGRARKTVILQRSGERIGYSKPVLYPLLAAPFFKVIGRPGLWLLNALVLCGALALFWGSVRGHERRGRWVLTIATFTATGAVLPQLLWTTPDTLQIALALAGTVLALDRSRGALAPHLGGLCLGLLIGLRLPNAILALAVLVAVGLSRRRWLVATTLQTVTGVVLVTVLNAGFVGHVNPYKAERATFNERTGYPAGEERTEALDQFAAGRATQAMGVVPNLRPRLSAYSALYYFVGRHTGLVWYFPAALLLFAAALRRLDPSRAALLAGIAALVAFYLLWMPENYFGGASFVGNRYVLPALGLLLPALGRPPRTGPLLAVWTLFALLLASAFYSVAGEKGRPYSSQSHALGGVAKWLPYESTALSIENRRDRYFSDEFLRAVDRRARVGDHGFHLRSDSAPAEFLIAIPRPAAILRFLVKVDRPEAEFVYRDLGGEQRFVLPPTSGGSGGLVELVAGPAWRRHPFWFSQGPWDARSVELSIAAQEGAEADVRYLGPYRTASKFFGYRRWGRLDLPKRVSAGGESAVTVRLINTGARSWTSEADVPVHLVHRISRVDEPGDRTKSRFTPLPEPVPTGERMMAEVRLKWPRREGIYAVEIDLVLAGVEPFSGWMESPVMAWEVEVVPPGDVVSSP